MNDLYALLNKCEIPYQRFDHKAVFTCKESEGLDIKIPGAHTKQLLMRDKKKKHYVLAIVMHDKTVDTKTLGAELKIGRLSFASEDDLKTLLGVGPGSVTPFGLTNDTHHIVHVIIDEDAWNIGQFRFHPLVNTTTLVIDREGLKTFLLESEHSFSIRDIPLINAQR
jgi:Ala-tRNA(Pro) deacylase